jgi:hypothetical protein
MRRHRVSEDDDFFLDDDDDDDVEPIGAVASIKAAAKQGTRAGSAERDELTPSDRFENLSRDERTSIPAPSLADTPISRAPPSLVSSDAKRAHPRPHVCPPHPLSDPCRSPEREL